MSGPIASGLKRRLRTSGGDAFYMFMVGTSAMPNRADLGNLAPTHCWHFIVEVNNELADLCGKGQAAFSCSPMLFRRKEASHPQTFKLIRFAGQRALGDIDFFRSLPCGFVKQDEGPNFFVERLLRPQRPLLNLCPLVGTFAAGTLRARQLPLPFRNDDASFKRTRFFEQEQGFTGQLALLAFQCLPA